VHSRNRSNNTALFLAERLGNEECVALLREAGAHLWGEEKSDSSSLDHVLETNGLVDIGEALATEGAAAAAATATGNNSPRESTAKVDPDRLFETAKKPDAKEECEASGMPVSLIPQQSLCGHRT
jgi:hypothetical protein